MIKEKKETYWRELQATAQAYNKVFEKASPFTETVLKDLAKFCRAHTTTFHPDPRAHAMLEGRREVWLRIQENLQLTPEDIYALRVVKHINPQE